MKNWMFQRMGLMEAATETPAAGGTSTGGGDKVPTGGPQAVFGEGGGTPAPAATPATQTGGSPTEVAATPTPTPSPSVGMTEEQLQRLATSLATSVRPQAPAPTTEDPNRPMTPEERAQFEREFHVVKVTPQLFQQILGFAPESEAQIQAFEQFAQSIVRQANAMTMFQVQRMAEQREQQMRGHLDPIVQSHRQAQAKQLEDTFFTSHPDLKDFGGLIQEVALAEKARGTQFKSQKDMIDFVANKARTLLGNRAPSGSTQVSTTSGTSNAKPSMPTTSVGGRSGSSGSPQPASGPKAVFGDLDR
jgi:hypothetical protein